MIYKQLTKEDRIEIAVLLKTNHSITQISIILKRSKSTISRELIRNKELVDGNRTYNYSLAHKQTTLRRVIANKARPKINTQISEYIHSKLQLNWSPEQISGRLKHDDKISISYQTIYNYIYLNHKDWIKHLRILGTKGKYRRKYRTKIREKQREESKKKRIDTRPEIIETRSRLGDWEGDTIVGLEKTIHILTHVDRKSGYLIADKVNASSESVHNQTLISLGSLPKDQLQSITYDNGVQFSKHQYTEQQLGIPIYFAFPYHSWERGTNENTNGLLRQYYPKKTSQKNTF